MEPAAIIKTGERYGAVNITGPGHTATEADTNIDDTTKPEPKCSGFSFSLPANRI